LAGESESLIGSIQMKSTCVSSHLPMDLSSISQSNALNESDFCQGPCFGIEKGDQQQSVQIGVVV
jgi:hypothetical protein